MNLDRKKPGARLVTDSTTTVDSAGSLSIADGALDTLGCVIRTMGDISFPLADEIDPQEFQALCNNFARHVENGAAVPARDIGQSSGGQRQWSHIRRFFIDRRTAERTFVTERLGDYRDVVQKLVDGLRQAGQRDLDTEQAVRENLGLIENAVDTGLLPDIKIALGLTMQNIEHTFTRQKQAYEEQIAELNERMSNLREDLVAVQEEMKRDPLTDAFNRGAFDEAIVKSMNLHFVLHQPLAVLMIDLDNFKRINDSFGHSAGDEVLRQVGECLARSFIRRSDFVARFGGDEFAVILSDTTAKHAKPLIERFLTSVTGIVVPNLGQEAKISCSVGLTEAHSGDTAAEVVERADAALYEAKAAGRNCFRYAPPP